MYEIFDTRTGKTLGWSRYYDGAQRKNYNRLGADFCWVPIRCGDIRPNEHVPYSWESDFRPAPEWWTSVLDSAKVIL